MIVREAFDAAAIYGAMLECFDDIVEDDTPITCAEIDMQKRLYLEVLDNKGTIGFYELKPFNRTTLEVHPFILKNRRKHSLDSAFLIKKWFNSEQCPKMYKSLVTHCPSIYRHIKIFLLKVGFNMVGQYKQAFTKNGEQCDLLFFQLMRG